MVIQVKASVLSVLFVSSMVSAGEGAHLNCPLVLHQEQVEREELELAVDLAVSGLDAADEIFSLVDRLSESGMVERLVYLAVKHERDVAELEVKRQRLLLKRQEAEVEQYRILCSAEGAGRRSSLDEARRRYLQADCHRIGKDLAIAEVDLAYRDEVLESLRNLRESDVTTKQDIIRAELNVETARKRVEHRRRRVEACVHGQGTAKLVPRDGRGSSTAAR